MTSKKLLRLAKCKSFLAEIDLGQRFKSIYLDESKNLVAPELIKKVLICSGQVYYDLVTKRDESKNNV